jgi:arginyl-tRNA synthetase
MTQVTLTKKGGEVSYLVKSMALFIYKRARRGHDRMVVVFTAICATQLYESDLCILSEIK